MFILLGIVVLFVLLNVLGKRSSTSVNATDRDNNSLDLIARIDKGQLNLATSGAKFTSDLGTLTAADNQLATDLALGDQIDLSASNDGKSYYVRTLSNQLVLIRNRTGTGANDYKDSCLDVNTKNGLKCPAGATDISAQIEAAKKAAALKKK